ncbi:MAG: hypothetical protein WBD40_04985 [Tepidisphaeraceae bacterium]
METVDFGNLCRQANEWRRQAADLDFLGEIALPQAELEQLLKILGRFHKRVDEPELSFALAVGAVNWAYWRGVDEEESKGFRHSFMTHSLGYSDLREWDRLWGPAIERAICDWSKQPPRFGTYRYVGLILRHAGVPHSKIPRLAQLLQDIDRNVGWPNVPAARDTQIQGYVGAFFGTGCIGEHLASEAGLAYLRSLCADLMLLRSRSPQSVDDLPGYRPGLLPALLAHLELGPRVPAPQSFQLPYVIFDPSSGRIELVFDERLIRRRDPIQCDQRERRLFDARLDLGPGGIEPASTYSGRLPDGRSWSVKGWRYTDSGAWALFRADGRLVTTHSHGDAVSTGDYLLAVIPSLNPTELWPDAADDGERFLPDGTECRLWHIRLSEGDDGKLPNLHVTTSVHPWLEVVNAGPMTRWTELDGVCPEQPIVNVGGWTNRNSRRFRLTLTSGVDQRDLHPSISSDGTTSIVLSELSVGVVAELSLVPVGFQHGPRVTQTMRVVRFPGRIDVADGLWPLDDEASLMMSVSDGLRVEANDDLQLDAHERRVKVLVPPNTNWASLRALKGDASLSLRFPVRRCSFSTSDSPVVPAIFDRALLREMCDLGASCRTFTVSAIPGCTVDLIARDREGNSRVWRRGLRLGSNGRLELPGTELVDVTRNEAGILEIVVNCDGFEVATGALFVEPVVTDLNTGPWPPTVDRYLQLLRQPLVTPEGLDVVAAAPSLYRHARVIAAADCAFGLSPLSPSAFRLPVSAADWIDRCRDLLSNQPHTPGLSAATWKSELLAWLKAAPLPICPVRWEAAVRSLIAEIDRKIDISGPLSRLLAGIADPSVPDGLVHGWKCYVDAEHRLQHGDQRIIQANSYFSAAARGTLPWSAIAERLSAWALLRAGAVPQFAKSVATLTPTVDCPGLTCTLRAVSSLLALKRPDDASHEPGGLELSPREDDRLLASAIEGNPGAWSRAAEKCWLSAWLGWRWSIIMGPNGEHREEYRGAALARVEDVPMRGRELLSVELRSGVPHPIS